MILEKTGETKRVFFSCKDCKYKYAIDYSAYFDSELPTVEFLFRAPGEGESIAIKAYPGIGEYEDAHCPKCGSWQVKYKTLNATKSERHSCNDDCRNAIGTTCHCSCGGAHHGINWLYDPASKVRQNIGDYQ